MSIGSGLSSSFGWSKETVAYGTRVPPAKFIRARTAKTEYLPNRVIGEGIQSGTYGLRGDHLVRTHEAASASVEFDVPSVGALQLWENLMGGSSSSVVSGSAYGHTFTLQDIDAATSKSLTIQTNTALRGGTDKAKEVTGAKATSATFSVGRGELLTCSMEFDGRKYDTGQTLASPSYVAAPAYDKLFAFRHAALKLGTFGGESAVDGPFAFTCTINRGMDTEDFRFGNSGLKSRPVLNTWTEITGVIESDYIATADFEDRFTGMTLPSLVFEVVGDTAVTGAVYPTFRITLPGVEFTGPSQNNDGPAAPTNQWAFTWRWDGTNLPTLYQINAETSV